MDLIEDSFLKKIFLFFVFFGEGVAYVSSVKFAIKKKKEKKKKKYRMLKSTVILGRGENPRVNFLHFS